jgi:hypothetical protein
MGDSILEQHRAMRLLEEIAENTRPQASGARHDDALLGALAQKS